MNSIFNVKIEARRAFQKLDDTHSGYLDREDVFSFLTSTSLSLTDEEKHMVLSNFDATGDLKLSPDEFQTLFVAQRRVELNEDDMCQSCLFVFGCLLCLCTLGISCIPLCCYSYCVAGPKVRRGLTRKLANYNRGRTGGTFSGTHEPSGLIV
ncbi:hypothetical protein AAMO2058_000787500 [Amorphochlora amoebiformis]